MRNRKNILSALLAFISLAFTSNCLAANWWNIAEKQFNDDEYEKVIETVKPYSENLSALMFLTFSNLQLSEYTGGKSYQKTFKDKFDVLVDKSSIKNLDRILYFVNLPDKPAVVKNARKLADKVFKNINAIEDVPKLISFTQANDSQVRKMAGVTIKRILKFKRDVVNKGGTLRAKDIRVMQDPKLIKALLKNVSESNAADSLLLIEEPVLKYTSGNLEPVVVKLEKKINKAIDRRKKKHPKSNWDSAIGKKR
jgi:hypothetical protein